MNDYFASTLASRGRLSRVTSDCCGSRAIVLGKRLIVRLATNSSLFIKLQSLAPDSRDSKK